MLAVAHVWPGRRNVCVMTWVASDDLGGGTSRLAWVAERLGGTSLTRHQTCVAERRSGGGTSLTRVAERDGSSVAERLGAMIHRSRVAGGRVSLVGSILTKLN